MATEYSDNGKTAKLTGSDLEEYINRCLYNCLDRCYVRFPKDEEPWEKGVPVDAKEVISGFGLTLWKTGTDYYLCFFNDHGGRTADAVSHDVAKLFEAAVAKHRTRYPNR